MLCYCSYCHSVYWDPQGHVTCTNPTCHQGMPKVRLLPITNGIKVESVAEVIVLGKEIEDLLLKIDKTQNEESIFKLRDIALESGIPEKEIDDAATWQDVVKLIKAKRGF
mgnify:CR=1 FL=1